jgi:hypothetical protein
MSKTNKNPVAALGVANRVIGVVDLCRADHPETKQQDGESLAVVIIAKRHRLTITHARIVCQMAGIGGCNEQAHCKCHD